MSLSATTLKAGGNAALQAGHDLTLGAVQSGTRWTTQTTASGIDTGGSLAVAAGSNALPEGTQIKAGDTAALQAGSDLDLTAVTDSITSTKTCNERKKRITDSTSRLMTSLASKHSVEVRSRPSKRFTKQRKNSLASLGKL